MFGFLKKDKDSNPITAMATASGMSRKDAARLLRTNPDVLKVFEASYRKHEAARGTSDNLFAINAKEMARIVETESNADGVPLDTVLQSRIVNELLEQTETLYWDGSKFTVETFGHKADEKASDETTIAPVAPVTREEISMVPEPVRPQLSGHLMRCDIGEPSYPALLNMYSMYLDEMLKSRPDQARAKVFYDHFRQGLDILDLDEVTYEIIGTNPNSIGNWLPQIAVAAAQAGFFRIPKTRVVKVPLPILQLTRTEYTTLTPATLAIVDEWCRHAFSLEPDGDYFIKTGTYSSKFDFRNAHVTTPQEVRELGQYLLFIHYQALCRAQYDLSGRNQPCVYGVSTTNEWVVREFVPSASDKAIYHGMALRPEYRVFVDFDARKVIGQSPYWEPRTMKNRFENMPDAMEADQVHDSLIYRAAEPELMAEYDRNVQAVVGHVEEMLQYVDGLTGQWSIDIMQEGDAFYLIDMAVAENSAFYDCVPKELRAPRPENWLPSPEALSLPER